jgi:hypothetical protein
MFLDMHKNKTVLQLSFRPLQPVVTSPLLNPKNQNKKKQKIILNETII